MGLDKASAQIVGPGSCYSGRVLETDLECRVICAAGGFAITKADIFPLVAARGAGQVILVSYTFATASELRSFNRCF